MPWLFQAKGAQLETRQTGKWNNKRPVLTNTPFTGLQTSDKSAAGGGIGHIDLLDWVTLIPITRSAWSTLGQQKQRPHEET